MKFVQAFTTYTREYESPTSFWRWASYAAVAGTLRDNVYIDHGIQRTYPNIYVLLLADSAEHRKGVPCSLLEQLLTKLNHTKVITGRSSIQGIIEDLSKDVGNPKTGAPLKGGSCVLIADELASFFVIDPALIPLVTDMYEYRSVFNYRLKSTGVTTIKDLCVSLLAASNQTFLNEVYTKQAIYGGLLGRTFIISPDETRPANSLLDVNLANYNPQSLLDLLREVKKLKGPASISPAGKSLYNDWYEKLYNSYRDFPDRTGMTQRMHRGVLKIAMILAASDASLKLELNHMEEAIIQVTALRPNYNIFTTVPEKTNQSEIGTILLESLWSAPTHSITRKALLLNHWNRFSSQELNILITTLEAAGLVKTTLEIVNNTAEITYMMTPSCVEIFTKRHFAAIAAKNGRIQ